MNLKSVKKRIKDSQRSVSHGELAALEEEFDTQVAEKSLNLDEETRSIMLNDFVQQYIDGNDDPKIGDSKKIKDSRKYEIYFNESLIDTADTLEKAKNIALDNASWLKMSGDYYDDDIYSIMCNGEDITSFSMKSFLDGDLKSFNTIKDAKEAPMTCLEYVLENADLSEFAKDLLNDCSYALDDMENISKNELDSIADRYINENSDVIYTSRAEEYIRNHGGYKRAMKVLKSYGYDSDQADDVELVASLMCMEDHQSDWANDIDTIMSCIDDYVDEYSADEDDDE